MVGDPGLISNSRRQLADIWKLSARESLETYDPVTEELFDTLARWNEYLENHVPYFQQELEL